jgi:hypothetical protein
MQIYLLKFLFISFFFVSIFPLSAKNEDNSQFVRENADRFFDHQCFEDARISYEVLHSQGNYSPQILLRLAYIYERQEKYAESIYFLRKLQYQFGMSELDERVRRIIEENGQSSITVVSYDSMSAIVLRNKALISILCLMSSFLGFFLCYQSSNTLKTYLGVLCILLSMLGALSVLMFRLKGGQQAVIVKGTAFYEQASYASAHQTGLYAPGSMVEILSEVGGWSQVSIHRNVYWIPNYVLRKM